MKSQGRAVQIKGGAPGQSEDESGSKAEE